MPNTATKKNTIGKKSASKVSNPARGNGSSGGGNGSTKKVHRMSQKSHAASLTTWPLRKITSSEDSNSQLEKFFHDQLKDLYWAEKHLTRALPKMRKDATTEDLKTAIAEHTAQTQEHITRLEKVFDLLGKKPQAKKCDAMEGLVREGEKVIEDTQAGSMTRDVGIIMAAQKVEHYEIASYGTLVQLAETIGQSEIAQLLRTTLEEEKQTDQDLSSLAENNINWESESEEPNGDEDEDEDDDEEEDDE
jgi:ferritin-like metal-binding protein YciE